MDVSFSDDVKEVEHCVPTVKSVPGRTARISELEPTGEQLKPETARHGVVYSFNGKKDYSI